MTEFIDNLYIGNEIVFEVPIKLNANVIRGFQRGSKELGIPTANMDMKQLADQGNELKTGIYFGFALLNEKIHNAVVSVGWNPYYKNEQKTIEAHLIATLDDFYDQNLTVLLCGYLRDEANFKSLDELILAINTDILKTKNFIQNDSNVNKYINRNLWDSDIKIS